MNTTTTPSNEITLRQLFTAVVEGNITPAMQEKAKAEIAKLDATNAKRAEKAAEKAKAEAAAKVKQAEAARPKTYVVQEGDTLYKIAIKFYNRTSAWREIQNANKTAISMDGRVKAGQKIVLP